MARVKGAMMTRKRRNKTLKLAKSYWGSKSRHFKMAKQAVAKSGVYSLVLYEPSPSAVYNAIVPNYIAGMIYGAMCESVASELGARRTAMDAASKNASEMIDDLSLRYNRARQGAITQEITEIVAGAEH